jgi:hypothetical protein
MIRSISVTLQDFLKWYEGEEKGSISKEDFLKIIETNNDNEYPLLYNLTVDEEMVADDLEKRNVLYNLFREHWDKPVEVSVFDDGREAQLTIEFDGSEIVIEADDASGILLLNKD